MKFFLSLCVLLLLASCAGLKKQDNMVLQRVNFASIPGWDQDHLHEAVPVFIKSCDQWMMSASDKSIGKTPRMGKVNDWRPACTAAKSVPLNDASAAKSFFEFYFTPFRVSNDANDQGLFTGYYEIDLRGSLKKDARYPQPLYKMPPDKVNGTPYYTRKEINEGALYGKDLELLYVNDPVQAFFLHIQGSGRVLLEDGNVVRIGYAGQNGHPYLAIGRYMLDNNIIPKTNMSANTIKDWLYAHPEQAKFIMERNPSYVFFKDNSTVLDGPIGAQGVTLTKERSVAIDRRYIPLGVPLWIDTEYPPIAQAPGKYLRKLFIAQDTGGAIKGVVRGDIFYGYGKIAEDMAGNMKHKGCYTMLLPKTLAN